MEIRAGIVLVMERSGDDHDETSRRLQPKKLPIGAWILSSVGLFPVPRIRFDHGQGISWGFIWPISQCHSAI